MGFPGGSTGKEPDCQYRRCKRHRINLWVRKKPWRRKWQHALVFLPGKFREHESLGTTVHRVSKSQTQLLVHPHTQIFNIAKLERSYILDIFQLYFAFFFFFCANLRKNIKLDADAQLHASYFKPKCPQFSTLLQLQGNGENYTDFTLKYLF